MTLLNPAAEFTYSPRVGALFADLRHAGSPPSGTAVVTIAVGSAEQGAAVTWHVQMQSGRLQRVYFRAYGCPHFLAACEMLAQWLEGRAVAELSQWRWQTVESELQAPAAKRSRWLLLDDVVQQLIKAAR